MPSASCAIPARRFDSAWRAAAAGLLMASLFAPVEGRAGPLKVTTDSGPVKGSLVDGVAQFKGIPYAAPPVGKLRWRPPKRPEPWTQVRDATEFGPTCLQVTTLGPFAGPPSMEEDCLYLNVYSPNVDPDGKGKLPVIMWIHGGGNLDGASNGYDGSKLARQGHVVVVTINYRLGLLGFMAHPAIDAEGHPFANYGILDQQEAMRWIKRNIAAFGGDKNNVTIGGQSAGSVDSETHVMSPLAKGLFHRAIYQSVLLEPESLESAQAKGKAFSVAAGCGSGEDEATARCLRNLTARQIYDLSGTASTQASYISSIVQDGKIIPGQYLDAIEKGDFNHVPLLSGTTKDELTFAIGITEYFSGPPRVATSEADFEAAVNSYGGAAYPAGTLKKVRQFYPLESYPSPGQALNRLLTDPLVCQHRAHNQAYVGKVPIYYYEFADRTAPSIFPKMPGFEPLAYHTGDIQYVFPGWHGGDKGVQHELNAQQEELSDEIVASWTNFAWTGNPNGQGNRPWPKYSNEPNRPSILSQNVPTSSVISDAQFNAEHQCDFWESISHW
ncbi:carboxylesterase/lipase family protein [Hansschlegelia zhihuaiae]|nr:carboxylesterase family protein [Hansschlegelia zhihuaiae]